MGTVKETEHRQVPEGIGPALAGRQGVAGRGAKTLHAAELPRVPKRREASGVYLRIPRERTPTVPVCAQGPGAASSAGHPQRALAGEGTLAHGPRVDRGVSPEPSALSAVPGTDRART